MNKKKILNIAGIAILVLMLIVCGYFGFKNFQVQKNKSTLPIDTDKTETTEKTIEIKTDFYEITAKYPVEKLDKENLIKQFIDYQVEQKKEDWKEGGEIYNEEKEVEKQFPDRPKMTYLFNVNYQKFESTDFGTVSYVLILEEYTGGANGNAKVQTFTFNKDGFVDINSILDLAGSVKDENGNTLYNDLALTKKLQQKALTNPEEFPVEQILNEGLGLSYLKPDGVTLDHEKCMCDGWLYASNLQNFVVSNQGLTFYFNKYEITIGASGISSISLDWESLEPYRLSSFN
jgi:hypothetical protein